MNKKLRYCGIGLLIAIVLCVVLYLSIRIIANADMLFSQSSWDTKLQASDYLSGTVRIWESMTADVPLGELTPYPFKDFYLHAMHPRWMLTSGNRIHNIRDFNEWFPIQSVFQIDEDHVCVPYRLQDEKEQIYLLIVFNRSEEWYFNKQMPWGWYENWTCIGEFYLYSPSNLSGEYYSSLKIGDSMEDVMKNDPLLAYELSYGQFLSDEITQEKVMPSYRITDQGLYVIYYDIMSDDLYEYAGNLISDIEYYAFGEESVLTTVSGPFEAKIIKNKDIVNWLN